MDKLTPLGRGLSLGSLQGTGPQLAPGPPGTAWSSKTGKERRCRFTRSIERLAAFVVSNAEPTADRKRKEESHFKDGKTEAR